MNFHALWTVTKNYSLSEFSAEHAQAEWLILAALLIMELLLVMELLFLEAEAFIIELLFIGAELFILFELSMEAGRLSKAGLKA